MDCNGARSRWDGSDSVDVVIVHFASNVLDPLVSPTLDGFDLP